ncbi:MAG: BLUF domain-containing protein [bacterium]
MELVHCIYCSAAKGGAIAAAELSAILADARRNNARLEVSGMLLYEDGAFFQILEGDRTVVEGLFDKIFSDPRHGRVTKIVLEPIANRSFAEWTMGYPRITRAELSTIPGLNDFFGRGHSFLELEEGRAKTLLDAFKEGRWRLSMQ